MSSDIFNQTYADTITSVIQATIEDNPETLEKFLEEKKSFRITDNTGRTPLHYACLFGRVKCLDVILKSGKRKKWANCFNVLRHFPRIKVVHTVFET